MHSSLPTTYHPLFFHPLDIFARSGVDADQFAHFDEGRALNFSVGFDLARLRDVRRRVAFDARFAIFDAKNDVVRRRKSQRVAVEEHHLADHAFGQILPSVIDRFGRQFVLLVGFIIHEDPHIALSIEILGSDLFDISGLERFATALVGSVQHRPTDQVSELALIESLPFAWLDEIALDHDIRIAVDLDFQSLTKIARTITCHGQYPFPLEILVYNDYRLAVVATMVLSTFRPLILLFVGPCLRPEYFEKVGHYG